MSLSAPPRTGLNINFISRSTHSGFKSKTHVVMKKGLISLKHNSFTNDVPIAVALKAQGVQSDKEISFSAFEIPSHTKGLSLPTLRKPPSSVSFTTQQAKESNACYSEGGWSAQTSLGGGHGVIGHDCLDARTGCQSRFDCQGTCCKHDSAIPYGQSRLMISG